MPVHEIQCPACGGLAEPSVVPYRNTHPVLAGLSRATCRICDMAFAMPMPDEDSWKDYNSSYFDNAHGGGARNHVADAYHSAIARLRVEHVAAFLRKSGVTVSAVLEVGPGRGDFARHWLALHPTVAYEAVESDVSCHPGLAAMGVRMVTGSEDASASSEVDLVVLSHVLEHVIDPAGFLRSMTMRLRPGGVVFVEVPCRDWEHKVLDEPHLLFFDKTSMRSLLDRIGFEPAQLSYHGQLISRLRAGGSARRLWGAIRFRLLSAGVVAPFDRAAPALETPLERAVVRPFEAHREHPHPAWWLRTMAVKQ